MTGPEIPSPPVHTTLTLVTLGGAELVSPTGPVLGAGKPMALLTYLALSSGHAASRDFLIDLLWADLDSERARHALRQTLWQLRQTLGEDVLIGGEEITLGISIASDRDAFMAAVSDGDYEAAVQLYRGPFLPAFAAPGGTEFEHWADLERDRLRSTFVRASELLVRRKLASSHIRDAQRIARRARDAAPANEHGWRLLLESLVAGRDFVTARVEADALEAQSLGEGRTMDAATRAAIAAARRVDLADPSAPEGSGLVAELIGREREFAAIIGAWEGARRGPAQHIHVSGAAGLGKTRLLQDAEARLRAGGVRIIRARANLGDRTIPYALAGDLARLIVELPGAIGVSPASAGSLISMNPLLSSRISSPQDASVGDEALRRRTLALGEAIAAAADDAPFALMIDDIHWSDSQSFRLLEGLIPRLDTARVLLVTTSRPIRDRHLETQATACLRLNPLTVEQVREFTTSLGTLPGAEAWTTGFAADLHRGTGGSPLLVLATLKLALDEGLLTLDAECWHCAEPARLDQMLEAGTALKARITNLDQEERRVSTILAIAGAPLTVEQLARVSRTSELEIDAAILELERRGLVARNGDSVTLDHDELTDPVIETAGDRVPGLEGALGAALAAGARDHVLLARAAQHLARAGDGEGLRALYQRTVRTARQSGDRRPFAVLAKDLLGEEGDAETFQAMVLSLPLTLRSGLWSRQRIVGAAALALAMIAIPLVARSVPSTAEPGTAMILWRVKDSLGIETRTLEVIGAGWTSSRPLEVSGRWNQDSDSLLAKSFGRVAYAPDGKSLAYTVARDNFATDDIVVRNAAGVQTWIAGPRDDAAPTWSSDQRHLAFMTLRWSSDSAGDFDIGVKDLSIGVIRQITRTQDHDWYPTWSVDGTRIAFVRRYRAIRPRDICWVTPDGAREHCRSLGEYDPESIVGWAGPERLLVHARTADRSVLLRVDPDGEDIELLFEDGVADVTISPEGDWVACRCLRPGGNVSDWFVFPLSDPSRLRALELPAGAPLSRVFWKSATWNMGGLQKLVLTGEGTSVNLGAPHRLYASGLDGLGRRLKLRPEVMSWRSSDTATAAVDTLTGEIHPRRTGRVTITASAGGWKHAAISLEIVPAGPAEEVLREQWNRIDTLVWRLYGIPKPSLAAGPGGIQGLNNNGDGSYNSGVYSLTTFSARSGLGVDALVHTPITESQWQRHVIQLNSVRTYNLTGWDHRSMAIPVNDAHPFEYCGLQYPTGEGYLGLSQVSASAGTQTYTLPVRRDSMTTGWHLHRVQIFPDGSCGVALDGKPMWRSRDTLPLDVQYRLEIAGHSVRTTMITGPLTVWRGVKRDIDWREVPK